MVEDPADRGVRQIQSRDRKLSRPVQIGIEGCEILDWMGVDKGNVELVHVANQMQALVPLKAARGALMVVAFDIGRDQHRTTEGNCPTPPHAETAFPNDSITLERPTSQLRKSTLTPTTRASSLTASFRCLSDYLRQDV